MNPDQNYPSQPNPSNNLVDPSLPINPQTAPPASPQPQVPDTFTAQSIDNQPPAAQSMSGPGSVFQPQSPNFSPVSPAPFTPVANPILNTSATLPASSVPISDPQSDITQPGPTPEPSLSMNDAIPQSYSQSVTQPNSFQPTTITSQPTSSFSPNLPAAAPTPANLANTGMPPQFGQSNMPPTPAINPTGSLPPTPLTTPQASKSKTKKLVMILLAGLVLTGGASAAGYFGWYIPNKPENVWASSLKQSGQLVKKLAAESAASNPLKSVDFKSTAEVNASGVQMLGDLGMKYTNQNFDGDLKLGVVVDKKKSAIDIKFLSSLAPGARYPDSYFKITGLKALNADSYMSGLSSYDDKWISVEAKYLESVIDADIQASKDKPKDSVTSQEITDLTKSLLDITSDYVLTDNKAKAVIVIKKFIGQEDVGSKQKANHYKAGINKDHAKQYCREMTDKVLASPAYSKLVGTQSAEDISKEKESCDKDIDAAKLDASEFDIWIDLKTKLIKKMRFEDQKNPKTYLEISQDYQSGDEFPIAFKLYDDPTKTNFILSLKLNIKAQSSDGKATISSTSKDKYDVTGTFNVKPYSGEVKITKPSPVIPIETILEKLKPQ